MSIILIKPNKKFELVEISKNDLNLNYLNNAVGGYVDVVRIGHNIDLWINDEGKIIDLEPTLCLVRENEIIDIVMGNIVVTSTNSAGDTIPLTFEQVKTFHKMIGNGVYVINDKEVPFINID